MCVGEVLGTANRQEYKPLGSFQVEHYGSLCLNSSGSQNNNVWGGKGPLETIQSKSSAKSSS